MLPGRADVQLVPVLRDVRTRRRQEPPAPAQDALTPLKGSCFGGVFAVLCAWQDWTRSFVHSLAEEDRFSFADARPVRLLRVGGGVESERR